MEPFSGFVPAYECEPDEGGEINLFQLNHICMDEQYRDMVTLNALANNEIRMVIYITEL